MSFGKKSPAYEPINADMLSTIGERFSNVPRNVIRDIFGIMTRHLHTETLLFVSLVSLLSRHIAGKKDGGGFGFGPSIRLSALRKDLSGKMQTSEMELLHDVLVELPMAGRNFARLQEYLGAKFHASIVMYHSCSDAIVDLADVESFHDASDNEQYVRTGLDWNGSSEKEVLILNVLDECDYSTEDGHNATQCLEVALEAVRLHAHQSVPTSRRELLAA